MNDFETIELIVLVSTGKTYRLDVWPNDSVGTRASVKRLVQAIAERRKLSEGGYDLYVRIPPDKSLSSLGLDHLEAIVLLPSSSELGDVYKPGDDKGSGKP